MTSVKLNSTKASAPRSRGLLLSVDRLSKVYPGVVALKDLDLDIAAGEVHAIVGENGAGKSTLIKMLAGAVQPSGGTISIDGEPHDRLTPTTARALGVAVIYQEFTLVPTLTAAENVFLGHYPRRGPVLDRREMHRRTRELFERLSVAIPPGKLVSELTTGYQQIVEIAKALSHDARLLIMDEPSAPLTASEVESMYAVVDALKAEGITIIYISHRMEEIFRLADRVSVLRDGRHVTTLPVADTTRGELIRLMVGRELSEEYPPRSKASTDVALKVRHLTGNGVHDVSFDLHRGEILGFGGLIGAGRTELMELVFGSKRAESGRIELEGADALSPNPIAAIRRGIALVPEDRKRHGVVLPFTIEQNITLPSMRSLSRRGIVSSARERNLSRQYLERLRIKAPSVTERVENLSGGNQQKVVLAKWLAKQPRVLIFDEPTRGIDVGAKVEIYRLMNELTAAGISILMVSSEMEELIGMSDRIAVLRDGRLMTVLDRPDFSQESILAVAAGGESAQEGEIVD